MSHNQSGDLIYIGKLTSALGLKGEIKLFHGSGQREKLSGLKELYLLTETGEMRKYSIYSIRYQGKTPVVSLDGIEDRTSAERISGSEVFVEKGKLAPLDEDEYYVDDLIGMLVYDAQAGSLGAVTGILDNPAHDILRVDTAGDGAELLIPMVDAFIMSIDMSLKEIHVKLPKGLPPNEV